MRTAPMAERVAEPGPVLNQVATVTMIKIAEAVPRIAIHYLAGALSALTVTNVVETPRFVESVVAVLSV